MGMYSWMDCCNPKQNIKFAIYFAKYKPSYLLVPEEFGGGHIEEPNYDGFGHFGGRNVFEIIAEWNRTYLTEDMIEPVADRSSFGGLYSYEKNRLRDEGKSDAEIKEADEAVRDKYYQQACKRHDWLVGVLTSYRDGKSDDEIAAKYGDGWKMDLGIEIWNSEMAQLRYTIKVTYDKDAVYESCPASESDPNQGY